MLVQVVRGVTGGLVATAGAVSAHVLAGGARPGEVVIALAAVVCAVVGVVLAGSRITTTLAVGGAVAAQVTLQASLVVVDVVAAPLAAPSDACLRVDCSTMPLLADWADFVSTPGHQVLALVLTQTLALLATVAVTRSGEEAWRVLESVLDVLVRSVLSVLRVLVVAVVAPPRAAGFDEPPTWRRSLEVLLASPRRGPPVPSH